MKPFSTQPMAIRWTLFILLGLLLGSWPASAAEHPPFLLGLGDSIGEGVQSADASFRTQPFSYLNWVAFKLQARFPLPLIRSGPFGVIGDTRLRSRLFPFFAASNIAVSGASVGSLLGERADARRVREIDSETDLVIFPRRGSQIEVAEAINPSLIVCWIGSNDALGAVLSWDQLDASQMTPVDVFSNQFHELAQRLGALNRAVVLANIPDVTRVGFLVDRGDLQRFAGSDFGLPDGDFTTLPVLLILRLRLDDGRLLQVPRFVLDSDEVELVRERVLLFNQIIEESAAGINAPVVDAHRRVEEMIADPPEFLGIPLTRRFLGGLFSLDAVHPSNIGHAMIADEFIRTMNEHFQTQIPQLTGEELLRTFLADPFVDKDGDGRVTGRPFAGLLETLGPLLGISGDPNDSLVEPRSLPEAPGEILIEPRQMFRRRLPFSTQGGTRDALLEAFERIWGRPKKSPTPGQDESF